MQLSQQARNAQLNAIGDVIGENAVLRIFSGPAPRNCREPDSGERLLEISLSGNFFNPAQRGSASISSKPTALGLSDGNAGHFRIFDSHGTCHAQGTCGRHSCDMNLTNLSIAEGQEVDTRTLLITAGNK